MSRRRRQAGMPRGATTTLHDELEALERARMDEEANARDERDDFDRWLEARESDDFDRALAAAAAVLQSRIDTLYPLLLCTEETADPPGLHRRRGQ